MHSKHATTLIGRKLDLTYEEDIGVLDNNIVHVNGVEFGEVKRQ